MSDLAQASLSLEALAGTGLQLVSSSWIPVWRFIFLITSNVLEFRIVAIPTTSAKLGTISNFRMRRQTKTRSFLICIIDDSVHEIENIILNTD